MGLPNGLPHELIFPRIYIRATRDLVQEPPGARVYICGRQAMVIHVKNWEYIPFIYQWITNG